MRFLRTRRPFAVSRRHLRRLLARLGVVETARAVVVQFSPENDAARRRRAQEALRLNPFQTVDAFRDLWKDRTGTDDEPV